MKKVKHKTINGKLYKLKHHDFGTVECFEWIEVKGERMSEFKKGQIVMVRNKNEYIWQSLVWLPEFENEKKIWIEARLPTKQEMDIFINGEKEVVIVDGGHLQTLLEQTKHKLKEGLEKAIEDYFKEVIK